MSDPNSRTLLDYIDEVSTEAKLATQAVRSMGLVLEDFTKRVAAVEKAMAVSPPFASIPDWKSTDRDNEPGYRHINNPRRQAYLCDGELTLIASDGDTADAPLEVVIALLRRAGYRVTKPEGT